MRIILAAGLAATLTLGSPAHAQRTADEFLRIVDAGGPAADVYKIWIHGVADGIGWANAELRRGGQRPLYCPPEKLPLTADQEVEVLRSLVREHPGSGASPAGLVLFVALQRMFPCKPSN
jgi:hypothetical protein